MLPYSPYFHLTKFLPDGGETSFYGYVDQLVKIVKNWPLEKKAHLALLRKQAELDKKKSGKPNSWSSLGYRTGLSHLITSQWWNYACDEVEFGQVHFTVHFYRTKIPHFHCTLEPLPSQRNQYKELIVKTLYQGIADEIHLREPTHEIMTLGQLHWVYLQQKMSHFKELVQLHNHEKSSSDEPSLTYEFSQQVEKALLPNNTSSLVELKEVYVFDPDLSQTEIKQRRASDKKKLVEFFEKYDRILLDTWGKEKFSEMLEPLNVSLEEWLNAGKD